MDYPSPNPNHFGWVVHFREVHFRVVHQQGSPWTEGQCFVHHPLNKLGFSSLCAPKLTELWSGVDILFTNT